MPDRNHTVPQLTYDPEADALAIDLVASPVGRVLTRRLTADHHLDFDSRGRLVGIEVLHASRHYPRTTLERLPNGVEWLTLEEAARESGLAASTLRNQINAQRLPAVKRGRDWLVAGHELWNYMESRSPRGRRSPRERGARATQRKAKVQRA
jgi:uncharacterized protein YuzE